MFHSSWMFRLLNTSSFAMDNDGLCHFKWMQGKYFASLWKCWRQSPHLILMIGSPPRVPKLNNDPVQGWDQMVVGICRVFICKRHFPQKFRCFLSSCVRVSMCIQGLLKNLSKSAWKMKLQKTLTKLRPTQRKGILILSSTWSNYFPTVNNLYSVLRLNKFCKR